MSKLHNFLKQFDGYVILDHFDDIFMSKESYNRKYQLEGSKTVHVWSVEITLTGGEVREFYVKARTKQDAIEKAESYAYLAEINYKNGEIIYLP